MKTQRVYAYLTLAAMMGFWSCSSSRQTAENAGDSDDLYGNYGSSAVYAGNNSSSTYESRPQQRYNRQQQRALRNANPDYNDEQYNANGGSNTDEYYSELSTRNLKRGISPDPGWGDTSTNAYNSGFVNGYNSATTSAYSWNRWGFNNYGFSSGLGLGYGLGSYGFGYPGVSLGFGSPFYSPFGYGSAFAYSPFYSPFGYGYGGYYDSFYSPFGYGGYYGSGYGYGSYYGGSVAYVKNAYVTGADPYRNGRTYGPTGGSSGRYNDAFVNTVRPNNGGRSGAYNSAGSSVNNSTARSGTSGNNNTYYAAPRANNRGSYYYDNGSGASSNGRSSANVAGSAAPSYNSNNGYYSSPRQQSRGNYVPSNGGSSSSNGFSQPSYQNQSRSYSQPSFSQPSHNTFSQPSTPSFGGARSSGFSSGGGGSFSGGGGGHVGGGGRGPR